MDQSRTVEHEYQAALGELDRAFRSAQPGERYQAVVTLSELLRKYPFPLLVNNAVLKVSDLFKNGNNLLRMAIVRAMKRSVEALERVFSVDEICRRLVTVSHSNDPVARALTLRLLGVLSPLLAEQKQIHHLIGSSLDSRDAVELQAAIKAACSYAIQSKSFARSIFEKISALLMGLETPLEKKLHFFEIIPRLNSHAPTAAKAFKLCEEELIPQCSSQSVLCLILNVLTQLALRSLLLVPTQIALLISVLGGEYGFSVEKESLSNLLLLARSSPHHWDVKSVQVVLDGITESKWPEDNLVLGLEILLALTASSCAFIWLPIAGGNTMETMLQRDFECHGRLTLLQARLLHCLRKKTSQDEKNKDLSERCKKAASNSLLTLLMSKPNDDEKLSVDIACTARIFVREEMLSARIVAGILQWWCLESELSRTSKGRILSVLCNIVEEEMSLKEDTAHWAIRNVSVLLPLSLRSTSRLLFPSAKFKSSRNKGELEEMLPTVGRNSWEVVVLAQTALENGWPEYAHRLLEQVSEQTGHQLSSYYVNGLAHMAEAERMVVSNGAQGFSETAEMAFTYYKMTRNQFSIMGRMGQGGVPFFLKEFCESREVWLRSVSMTEQAYFGFSLIPASSLIHVLQISNVAKLFGDCARGWKCLEEECFDADEDSLFFLRSQATIASLFESALHVTLGGNWQHVNISQDPSVRNQELHMLMMSVQEILISIAPPDEGEFSLKKNLGQILSILRTVVEKPLHVPPFFFRSQQNTEIKLLLSPSPQNSSSLVVLPGQSTVIKVEGVISYGGLKPKSIRSVSKVLLTLSLRFHGPLAQEAKMPKLEKTMKESLVPRNNYFSTEFLLNVPQSCFVVVAAEVVDKQSERVWNPRASAKIHLAVPTTQQQ